MRFSAVGALWLLFACCGGVAAQQRWSPRVAVVNPVPFHNEVYPAVIHALWLLGVHDVHLFRGSNGLGIDAIMRPWLNNAPMPHELPYNRTCEFDIIFLPTFPEGAGRLMSNIQRSNCNRPQIVAGIVHNPSRLRSALDFIQQYDMQLYGLADHVSEAITRITGTDHQQAKTFFPVFPFEPSNPTELGVSGVVVQGNLHKFRRNYDQLFREAVEMPSDSALFPIVLVGKGAVEIPATLQENHRVYHLGGLPYRQFYDTIAKGKALVPSFASNMYYRDKASSTVAASVITLTPLAADSELVSVYNYLTNDSVLLVQDTRLETLNEKIKGRTEAIRDNLRRVRDKLVLANTDTLRVLLEKWRHRARAAV